MKRYFISREQKQYKANLHCHSTASSGKLTPSELKEAYKKKGYSVLAVTDHEFARAYRDLSDGEFLMLTGYEASIRPNPERKVDTYRQEVHLNLFSKEADNERLVCYSPYFGEILKKNGLTCDEVHRVGSERPREYSVEYVNEFIRTARENGYLVSYNHPVWSMEEESRVMAYEGIFSLEVSNYSASLINGLEHSGALYDKMLRRGMRVFCHGGDDNHNREPFGSPACDSFGAWTVILGDSLEYSSVISAMEKGDMYASEGPSIYEVFYEDGKVHVECSDAARIILYFGAKSTARVFAKEGETLTSADLALESRAQYFRVAVIDEKGRIATTRGFFCDEI